MLFGDLPGAGSLSERERSGVSGVGLMKMGTSKGG